MAKLTIDEALTRITEWLRSTYGPRLVSVVVYGSAAAGDHHERFSDINLLAVLDQIDSTALDAGAEAMRWWVRLGNRPIVLLSSAELEDAADVFSIEYLDIQAQHRVLAGSDPFAQVPRFPEQHRQQVEHDLRSKLIRLRARYMLLRSDAKAVEKLMLESVSTFLTLFRHALVALGQSMISSKQSVAAVAGQQFGFSPEPFARILAARRDGTRLTTDKSETYKLFAAYLEAIQKVERRLEEAA